MAKHPVGTFYVTTYCNFAHRLIDGKPIDHECAIIPPAALEAERSGDIPRAIELMEAAKKFRVLFGHSLPSHPGVPDDGQNR